MECSNGTLCSKDMRCIHGMLCSHCDIYLLTFLICVVERAWSAIMECCVVWGVMCSNGTLCTHCDIIC